MAHAICQGNTVSGSREFGVNHHQQQQQAVACRRLGMGYKSLPTPRKSRTLMMSNRRRDFKQQKQHSIGILCAAATDAAQAAAEPTTATVDQAVAVLHNAVIEGNGVPAKEVLGAILALEKAKPKIDVLSALSGSGSTMRRWRLFYTASVKEQQAFKKALPSKGGLFWPPIPIALGFTADGKHENGVYLGHIASIRFNGKFSVNLNKAPFGYSNVVVSIGPWRIPFPIDKNLPDQWTNPTDAPGMFLVFYVDEKIFVARGKTGGVAIWRRASPSWELKAGVY